ncbi:hypothetical protein ABZ934_24345 [Streptomyces sp. NPDC046557]|uniref:hypothetical protein n=1 Tax=Streptomyces sp. NPDC046557 TaxID=3155372 RepID=UPI0033EC69B0
MKEVRAVTPTPEPDPEPEPTVVVTDTGGDRATGEGTAVTGYRAPAPRVPLPGAGASTRVSGTGDATASGGGIANSGIFTYIQPRREPVTFPHQVGVLPTKLGYFQDRAAVSALREAVAGRGTAVVCQDAAGAAAPLITRAHLAAMRGEAGDAAGAAADYEQVLEHMLRVLGPDHLHTLAAWAHLAGMRGRAGDVAGMVAATEELLEHMLRVLGPDHVHTLTARAHLAAMRGRAGNGNDRS